MQIIEPWRRPFIIFLNNKSTREKLIDELTAVLWVRRVIRNKLDLPTKQLVSNKQQITEKDHELQTIHLILVFGDVVQLIDGLREVANREADITEAAILLVPRMNAHMMMQLEAAKTSKLKS